MAEFVEVLCRSDHEWEFEDMRSKFGTTVKPWRLN
jgi:hypothetical protein